MFFISLQKLFSFLRKSNFKIPYFQTSWRHQMPRHKRRNTFHLGSKNSDLMKLDQFMSYYKRKKIIKKFHKNCGLKPISRPFCVCKELSTTSIEKQNFWTSWKLSKFVLRIPFPEDSLKIKQGLEIVSRPHFSYNFLIKNYFVILH